MARDKDLLKAIVKEQFYQLGKIVDNAKASQATFSAELSKIEALSKDYTEQFREGKKQLAQNEYRAKSQALYADTQMQLVKLQDALLELHGSLDLSNPALKTALDLIKNVGQDLGAENILKINAQFANNQPALRILQSAYKAANVAYNGSLERQIYEPESAVQALGQYARAALLEDGYSPFRFGVEVGKVASLEGVDFPQGNPFPSMAGGEPSTVDLGKFTDAMRSAAGLPVESQ
jgi:hypothetical protein